jgi:hypothetical protein
MKAFEVIGISDDPLAPRSYGLLFSAREPSAISETEAYSSSGLVSRRILRELYA